MNRNENYCDNKFDSFSFIILKFHCQMFYTSAFNSSTINLFLKLYLIKGQSKPEAKPRIMKAVKNYIENAFLQTETSQQLTVLLPAEDKALLVYFFEIMLYFSFMCSNGSSHRWSLLKPV